jgi:hypothetical protein
MVQAVINIPEETNRVLNIVKAKFGLKDKSQAIKIIVDNYETNFLEPELRPEFVEQIKKIQTEKFTKYNSIEDLERDIENA